MDEEDILTMSQKELRRLEVIEAVLEERIRQFEAGEILDLSDRQIRRLAKRVEEEGKRGIIHRLRGKPSNRRTDPRLKARILKLYEAQYWDFGPTLASEKLQERDGIRLSDETLRLWLLEARIPYDGRRARKHRQWRERKPCLGEMIQVDGSHHDWLEGRGPWLVLMGYKDDATGRVFARFYGYEGTIPALDSLRRYLLRYGIPQSLYLDKHPTYKSNGRLTLEDELTGREESLSQFARACEELGVTVIYAHSPQAKGRIERQFRTFQHRLIRELRLEGAKTLEEANGVLEGYLPKYNRRFGVLPANPTDLHRPVPKSLKLDQILCLKEKRVVRNDGTIAYKTRLYQIIKPPRAKRVTVEERLNGSLQLTHEGKGIPFKEILLRAKPQTKLPPKLPSWLTMRRKPSPRHPWRQLPSIPKERTPDLVSQQP